MKKRSNKNKTNYNNKIFTMLLIIATAFMGVGYATVNSLTLEVKGEAIAYEQEGVFITDVIYKNNINADNSNSKINYYFGTMLDSEIVLGNTSDSSITYQINIYNNSDKEYMFIGGLTDKSDSTLYSNENIDFILSDIEEYTTIISANDSISFTITFKYIEEADTTQNTLISKINFRFKEIPKLVLGNESKNYTLNDIYPDYTPQEYAFIVSNYDDNEINNVPMTYYFETTIDSPLSAKIYDENGNEVTGNITIEGNGTDKIQHNYILKIIWDDSNPTEDIDYNSSDYADKKFNCNIVLKSSPSDEEYLDYSISKEFNVDITTASFNFNLDADDVVKVEKTSSNLEVTINNYNSDSEYNNFDVDYEISIQNNDKFTYSIDGESPINDVFTRTLNGENKATDSFTINLAADIDDLDVTETATLIINIKSPYVETITMPLTISLQPVTVTLKMMDYAGNSSIITVYKGKTYSNLPTPTWTGHTFNGWYTASSGGTKISSTTEVTTISSTQTLYAQWTSHLLVDYVSVGDYVNYEIYYDNVATNGAGSYIPSTDDAYNGWRVLSIEGSGDDSYVRLISAGVPMTYRHPYNTSSTTVGKTSVTNLTTGFFSTSMDTTTVTDNKFHRCGFKTSKTATTYITSTSNLSTLFKGNTYTQLSGTTPMVQSVTKEDLDDYIAYVNEVSSYETENAEYLTKTIPDDDLFIIPSQTSGSYASYFLATTAETYYVWQVRFNAAVVYTYYEYGVRPVVSLKIGTLKTGGSGTVASPYTLGI